MQNIDPIIPDDDENMQKDFAESVYAEELDFDSLPAEFFAEFDAGMRAHKARSDRFAESVFDNITLLD